MSMIRDFSFATTPRLHFGAGSIALLGSSVKSFGTRVLLVRGARSLLSSPHAQEILHQLAGTITEQYSIDKEPTPAMIDAAVRQFSEFAPHCVVAIGGGSVLDAGKAISAMLPLKEPVKDYLEGVGTKPLHPGVKTPFVAIPTTSGTGSEATKNAVISEMGPNGYKRSLRHNNFVPDLAIIDPALTLGCPASVTAASGMDAFTQLLESYLSTAANPVTDALAYAGLKLVARSLKRAYDDGSNMEARTDMALASYLSGITLANAGLGLVHGFASPIGGYFNVPHGVICATLMGPANKLTVRKLRRDKILSAALSKYAAIGKIFSQERDKSAEYYTDHLLSVVETLTKELQIPTLSQFGITPDHWQKIVKETGNKNNPVDLEPEEMMEVLATASTKIQTT